MTTRSLSGKKILFANFPADGHFNPLTGLAVHLQQLGCDVRWYSSKTYTEKLKKLNIHHYPFKKAVDVIDNSFAKVFPDRDKQKTQVAKLKYDIIHAFILRGPEYYADIRDIQEEFDFDVMIADCLFTGIPFVKELMNKPVISMGIVPLTENSKDLAPTGLGMTPSYSFFGKIRQSILRVVSKQLIFREPNKIMHRMFDEYGIEHNKESVFDVLVKKSSLLLQSGTPGFEYYRSDMSRNVRFIGSLLPYSSNKDQQQWFDNRLNRYSKVVLVTQGTVEKDVNKIIVPTLEAFKDTDVLVLATTGGSGTEELLQKYPQENIIIRDFIPFADVMPYCDVYITNGGYGGVMLGIENRLPMIVAGVHEGKNEICARVGYFDLGINLKTEKPTVKQVKKAVEQVIEHDKYKQAVIKLGEEFNQYDPYALSVKYIAEMIPTDFSLQYFNKLSAGNIY